MLQGEEYEERKAILVIFGKEKERHVQEKEKGVLVNKEKNREDQEVFEKW